MRHRAVRRVLSDYFHKTGYFVCDEVARLLGKIAPKLGDEEVDGLLTLVERLCAGDKETVKETLRQLRDIHDARARGKREGGGDAHEGAGHGRYADVP